MEAVITVSLAIGIPLLVGATRPTRVGLAAVLAAGLAYATISLAGDDWHPTQPDDLAWAAIVYGVMSALIVVGWLAGRALGRRAGRAEVGTG